MNEVMRESYIKDCEIGIKRWNMQIQRAGHDLRLFLPHYRFRRSIGVWANLPVDPHGKLLEREQFDRLLPGWLPSEADKAFVRSLMQQVKTPGRSPAGSPRPTAASTTCRWTTSTCG